MRRPAAVILGTFTGAVLMTAAKLGTPPAVPAETVADAPFDEGFRDPASPGPASGPVSTESPEPQLGAIPTGTPPAPGTTTTGGAQPPSAADLKTGTFSGSAVTHKYGTLQISIVVNGGAITDIRWTYTTSSPLSKNINADALPKLRIEALDIQTAQVHTVSGATYTSNAYRTSLQSAIDRAK